MSEALLAGLGGFLIGISVAEWYWKRRFRRFIGQMLDVITREGARTRAYIKGESWPTDRH